MKHNAINLVGHKFGKLTVIAHAGTNARRCAMWACACACGGTLVTAGINLRRGATNSCGCLMSESKKRHGKTNTPTWNSWRAMFKRCEQVTHPHYRSYGGSGISVCDEWRTFEAFFADMGERPEGKTIDRINPSLGYFKENCRWASAVEQIANRKNAVLLSIGNLAKTARQWSIDTGTPEPTIAWRFKKGWSAEEAVFGRNA